MGLGPRKGMEIVNRTFLESWTKQGDSPVGENNVHLEVSRVAQGTWNPV